LPSGCCIHCIHSETLCTKRDIGLQIWRVIHA